VKNGEKNEDDVRVLQKYKAYVQILEKRVVGKTKRHNE